MRTLLSNLDILAVHKLICSTSLCLHNIMKEVSTVKQQKETSNPNYQLSLLSEKSGYLELVVHFNMMTADLY